MFKSGKHWPYIVGGAIFFIFSACTATVVVITSNAPVQVSDMYMSNYQDADSRANEIINAKIEFDKHYSVEYLNSQLSCDGTDFVYRITDRDGNVVENASIDLLITRPHNHEHDVTYENFEFLDGNYVLSDIELPAEGRWDLIARIRVDDKERFLNIKADTRSNSFYEF